MDVCKANYRSIRILRLGLCRRLLDGLSLGRSRCIGLRGLGRSPSGVVWLLLDRGSLMNIWLVLLILLPWIGPCRILGCLRRRGRCRRRRGGLLWRPLPLRSLGWILGLIGLVLGVILLTRILWLSSIWPLWRISRLLAGSVLLRGRCLSWWCLWRVGVGRVITRRLLRDRTLPGRLPLRWGLIAALIVVILVRTRHVLAFSVRKTVRKKLCVMKSGWARRCRGRKLLLLSEAQKLATNGNKREQTSCFSCIIILIGGGSAN